MAPRPLASATISFGLVSIPVKLYTSAESGEKISFHMLHKKCSTRLQYKTWCPKDGQMVERDDVAKGYEYAKDRFVVMTPEEIKALEEEATKAIAIDEFVALDQVDPVYYDKSYYLAPEKGGERAYRLLTKAMLAKGLAGVARYASRGKSYLVLVRAVERGLVMQQLHYANEVRAFADVPIEGKDDVRDSELKLALQLIEQTIAERFEPQKYGDEVQARMQEVIRQKIEGEQVTFSPAEAPKAQVIDLMEALKASLAGASADKGFGKAGKGAGEALLQPTASTRKAPARKAPARATGKKASK